MAGLQLRKGCVGIGSQDKGHFSPTPGKQVQESKSGAWFYSEAQGLTLTVDKGSHPSDYYFSLVGEKKKGNAEKSLSGQELKKRKRRYASSPFTPNCAALALKVKSCGKGKPRF